MGEYCLFNEWENVLADDKCFSNEFREKSKIIGLKIYLRDKGKMIRICREPKPLFNGEEDYPVLENGKKGKYAVFIIDFEGKFDDYYNREYKLIGWYSDAEDLYARCYVEGKRIVDILHNKEIRASSYISLRDHEEVLCIKNGKIVHRNVNTYTDLNEFYHQYFGDKTFEYESHIGIEFIYRGNFYRMCREPKEFFSGGKEFPILPDGRVGRYDVFLIVFNDEWGRFTDFNYELIGWYADLDDVLENCYIQGRKFKEVIMDEITWIDSWD